MSAKWESTRSPRSPWTRSKPPHDPPSKGCGPRPDHSIWLQSNPDATVALCEALRIAVEGLDVAHEALATAGVVYTQVVTGSISDSEGWVAIEKALRGPPPEGSIIAYDLADALAAVRELVDLGEKP